MPSLDFYDGDRLVFQHRLGPGRVVVGRSDGCDLWLDGEGISRRHAVLEPRAEGWVIVDRSRHGTLVNGQRVERAALADGDLIQIGPRQARFSAYTGDSPGSTTGMVRSLVHEEPVAVSEDGVTVARAAVEVTLGPRRGFTLTLDQARTRVGGSDEDDLVLPGLPPRAIELHAARGRVMIAPRAFPVRVEGHRVPTMMPLYEGETVELGDHAFTVTTSFADVTEDRTAFGELVGEAPCMRAMFSALARIAVHDHPVLLIGESGTGKELAAHALHVEGGRSDGPFVPINCAALPETLVESELFGHEKGAFTGATRRQDGAFQRADGGTLFLDEIGELKLDAQAKLLRALESREVRRVGAAQAEHPDVRVVAATNRDLTAMVDAGSFRGDLFFRLSVLTVRLPPVRERLEDLPRLARTLVTRHLPGATLSDAAMDRLAQHDWPGNVRELRNVLTRAYVLGGPVIQPSALAFSATTSAVEIVMDVENDERSRIVTALERAGGNKAKAARELGIPRSSLLYRLKKLGLN